MYVGGVGGVVCTHSSPEQAQCQLVDRTVWLTSDVHTLYAPITGRWAKIAWEIIGEELQVHIFCSWVRVALFQFMLCLVCLVL